MLLSKKTNNYFKLRNEVILCTIIIPLSFKKKITLNGNGTGKEKENIMNAIYNLIKQNKYNIEIIFDDLLVP